MKIKMAGNDWFWVTFKYENIPSFRFICGIIGHSEKFCGQLFEKPEAEISKPYGAWMSAPFKKQAQSHGRSAEEDDENMDPKITPEKMMVVTQGGNQGIRTIQNEVISEGQHGTNQANTTDSTNFQETNDTIIIKTKKRRTGDGLDNNSMGLEQVVQMDSDAVSELGYEKANNNPKNVYGAGTQVGALLPLWVF
ncbi:hypothetical protein AgCh_014310 [Apium graveolens]